MLKYLVLPKIGLNMTEGTIVEWLVKTGDFVDKNQIVVTAETDKAVQEITATESGRIIKILADVGDTVKCQEKIAILGDDGDENEEIKASKETNYHSHPEPYNNSNSKEKGIKKGYCEINNNEEKGFRISPLARKIAIENNIVPEELAKLGKSRRIVKRDVLDYIETQHDKRLLSEPEGDTVVPYSRMRSLIAKHLTDSANTKPRVSLICTVDCREMISFRSRLKEYANVSYNVIIAKACAMALKSMPQLNAITDGNRIVIKKQINIGVAVDTERGLVVPVLNEADKKGILELVEEFNDLIERVKIGKHSINDIQGGTFTVTNLGIFGVESFDPICNSPECFILGVGAIRKEATVIDDVICIVPQMKISLSFDHAAFDGATAAKLLQRINLYLTHPTLMLM